MRSKIFAALGLVLGLAVAAFATTDGYDSIRQSFQSAGGVYTTAVPSLSTGEHQELHLDSRAGLIIGGHVAHDSADVGNPTKIGVKATSAWATTVTANDRANVSADLYGRIRVETGGSVDNSWTIYNVAAANTAATASKAAGTGSERHVCTGFQVTMSSLGAPTPEVIVYQIRDGATGAGTVKWSGSISLPATAGISRDVAVTGLWIVGTAATAMTIETAAGGGANDYISVNLNGLTLSN